MKTTKIAAIVLATLTATSAFAATQPSPQLASQAQGATAYDLQQDTQIQAIATLANSGLNKTQAVVTQVNTVSAGVGANAQAIGATNASLGQTNQNVQKNTNQIQKQLQANAALQHQSTVNAKNIAQNTQGVQQLTQQANTQAQQTGQLAGQVGKNTQSIQQNTANIQNITQQSGNFVTKPDFQASQDKQDKALASGLAQKVDNGVFQQRAAALDAGIAANKAEAHRINGVVANHTKQLANHESRIQALESQTNANFANMDKQIKKVERKASAGVAGVAAMANIPQVSQNSTFSVGAGAGNYNGESAMAVGFSARVGDHVVTKASVSATTQNDFVVGVGASYEW